MAELLNMVGVFGIMFLLAVSVLWIALPFAIFGIKGLLKEILKELQN